MSDIKKLTRSRENRMIAGVCAGIATYFDIDPTIVRLVFVAFALLGGPGFIAYIVALDPDAYRAGPRIGRIICIGCGSSGIPEGGLINRDLQIIEKPAE